MYNGLSVSKTLLLPTYSPCGTKRHKYRALPFRIQVMKSLFLTWVAIHYLFTKTPLFVLVYIHHHVTNASLSLTHMLVYLLSITSTICQIYSPEQQVVAAQLGTQNSWCCYLDTNGLQQPSPCRWRRQIQKAVFFPFTVQFAATARRDVVHLPTRKSEDKTTKERQLGSHGVHSALSLTSGWLWDHLIPFTWAKNIAWYLCSLWTICGLCFKLLKKNMVFFNLANKEHGIFKWNYPLQLNNRSRKTKEKGHNRLLLGD